MNHNKVAKGCRKNCPGSNTILGNIFAVTFIIACLFILKAFIICFGMWHFQNDGVQAWFHSIVACHAVLRAKYKWQRFYCSIYRYFICSLNIDKTDLWLCLIKTEKDMKDTGIDGEHCSSCSLLSRFHCSRMLYNIIQKYVLHQNCLSRK